MATTASSTPKATANGRKQAPESLEDQVDQLRADIQSLAKTIGNIASGKASEFQAKAYDTKRDMSQASEQALKDIRARYDDVEASVSAHVRDKPLQSLGIAAGIGFLFALFARR